METINQGGETKRATITLSKKPNVKNVKLELKSPSHPFMGGGGRWSGQVGGSRPRADRLSCGWPPKWVRVRVSSQTLIKCRQETLVVIAFVTSKDSQ